VVLRHADSNTDSVRNLNIINALRGNVGYISRRAFRYRRGLIREANAEIVTQMKLFVRRYRYSGRGQQPKNAFHDFFFILVVRDTVR
jgi:hypothetical protein